MTGSDLASAMGHSLLIMLVIVLGSHVSVDKYFSPTVRSGAIGVLIVIVFLYILFGLVF